MLLVYFMWECTDFTYHTASSLFYIVKYVRGSPSIPTIYLYTLNIIHHFTIYLHRNERAAHFSVVVATI